MPKRPEVLGITPRMEQYKKMMETKKPEKAEFGPKSFEELKQAGKKRLEAGRDRVFSFKNKIKERMGELFSRIGSIGKTGLETAKAGYNKLENRAIGAYLRFQDKFEELQKERDFEELRLAQENVFEAKNRFNGLLIKNKIRWRIDIESLRM